ncbi:MAG: GDSL-type esterase/lipase family protein, partial [Planctomycetia bacterium]
SFPDLPTVNRGFGGSQTADAVRYARRIVTPLKPRLIVLYAGDNDLAKKKTPTQVFDDFRAFVAEVRKDLPTTPVVYLSIKPSPSRWNLDADRRETNALVQAHCETDPMLKYVDVATAMLDAEGRPRPELFGMDKLHMNDAGYAVWAEIVRPALR